MTSAGPRLRQWVREHTCRHDYEVRFGAGRIYLRCLGCHRETPGWEIDGKLDVRFTDAKAPTIRTDVRTVTRKLRRRTMAKTTVAAFRKRA